MGQSRKSSFGFTLLEVSMVLVVFALLGGAVLAAGELMTNARTRTLIGEMESVRGAYFGFVDRYRGVPGDYSLASRHIPGVTVSGNGNGLIEAAGGPSSTDEPIAVWEHLARAGFLEGGFVYAAGPEGNESAPKSPFGAFLRLEFGNRFASTTGPRHTLHTGNHIPANVAAEADRKVDDGIAASGTFRFSSVTTSGNAPAAAACYDSSGIEGGVWRITGAIEANCGATWLMN